jgi:hypothetical protein
VLCDLQLIFEGLWSNQTHPKDFPFSLWLTHFSDLIGASHKHNYSFWGEGQLASDGLRQVAEWGSVRGMEAELRAQVTSISIYFIFQKSITRLLPHGYRNSQISNIQILQVTYTALKC